MRSRRVRSLNRKRLATSLTLSQPLAGSSAERAARSTSSITLGHVAPVT